MLLGEQDGVSKQLFRYGLVEVANAKGWKLESLCAFKFFNHDVTADESCHCCCPVVWRILLFITSNICLLNLSRLDSSAFGVVGTIW